MSGWTDGRISRQTRMSLIGFSEGSVSFRGGGKEQTWW